MPPVSRQQSKKSKPYSNENRSSERRTALSNLNNGPKKCTTSSKSNIGKLNENVSKKKIEKAKTVLKTTEVKSDKIGKTETALKATGLKSEVSNILIVNNADIQSSTKKNVRTSLNTSKETTLYQTAYEELVDSNSSVKTEELYITSNNSSENLIPNKDNHSELYFSAVHELSVQCAKNEEVFEIDKANWSDFMYVGCYAREIFKYLKQREFDFIVTDYMNDQSELTPRHRAIVVNWLVNLQEMYELNHEILYMAVRLIDLYLVKNETPKNKFQLLASGALLLSSKIDKREVGFPNILVKQSKYIYTEEELLFTERELIKALNYDLNVPLSYVFLRRFARCMKCQMVLLTLARYILELSLLDYKFVTVKESLKASAALFLAFNMYSILVDSKEFFKYTGYSLNEIKDTVFEMNNMLHNQKSDLCAVRQKYLHKVFYNVAAKSLIKNSKLTFD